MVDLLRNHGGEVTVDIAAIYRQTGLIRDMLARGKADPAEVLRFGASGGDPEIVGMGLERIDWPRHDVRWFGILTQPLYFWHHIPWLYAGNKEFDRSTYLACFRLILDRSDPNVVGSFARAPRNQSRSDGGAAARMIDDFRLAAADYRFDGTPIENR